MPNPDTSILVVDDTKFSTTIITRTLKSGGYTNLNHADSAKEALAIQERTPASILIADWLMPEMDGLELTRQIRLYDEASNRHTYIIMLTARDGVEALQQAFDEGVDDFVNKSAMQNQLLSRVLAAERLVDNQNRLLRDNLQLLNANRNLQELITVDPLTGCGSRDFALQQLETTLEHSESRGDASCLLLIRISNWNLIRQKQPEHICNEILTGISRRLRNLVRPLDQLARMGDATFAVIAHQPNVNQCTAATYRRVHEGINLRAFKTSIGFLSLNAHMCIASAQRYKGTPDAKQLVKLAQDKLAKASDTHNICEVHYQTHKDD